MASHSRRSSEVQMDAAIDKQKKTIGLGIVERNSRGQFVATFSKQQQIEVEPVIDEAFAALHAILFCPEQGVQHAILEGDAAQVILAVNSNTPCASRYGHFV